MVALLIKQRGYYMMNELSDALQSPEQQNPIQTVMYIRTGALP